MCVCNGPLCINDKSPPLGTGAFHLPQLFHFLKLAFMDIILAQAEKDHREVCRKKLITDFISPKLEVSEAHKIRIWVG